MPVSAARFAWVGCLALALGGCSLTRPEEEPAYVKATAVEERVDRIENQNKALLDLQREVDSVQAEVRHLRGEFEDFQHEAKASRDQQRDLYNDLDKHLTATRRPCWRGPTPRSAPSTRCRFWPTPRSSRSTARRSSRMAR